MKLAGMVGRPLGDLERAGDCSPVKGGSINKTIIAYRFVTFDQFIYHLLFFFIRWDLVYYLAHWDRSYILQFIKT
jgi:hypothetical protein